MPSKLFSSFYRFVSDLKKTTNYILILLTRLSSESPQKSSIDSNQNLAKYENLDKESKSIDIQRVIADDIDEGAWYVCSKVWKLLESPVIETNELQLNERVADIQVKISFYFLTFPFYVLI